MPVNLQFPLYALADMLTAQTIFNGTYNIRRMLLFTSAEKASRYRSNRQLDASIVKLREPKDLRMLFSLQDGKPTFDVEIDPAESEK